MDAAGRYTVKLTWAYTDDNTDAAQLQLHVDGARVGETVTLSRSWTDVFREETDRQGNAYRPQTVQTQGALTGILPAGAGSPLPLEVELTAGAHTLQFAGITGTVAIEQVELLAAQELLTYEDYAEKWQTVPAATQSIPLEAERVSGKSDASILLINDRTSPDTSPYNPSRIVYNTLGGAGWGAEGQWVEWTVTVQPNWASTSLAMARTLLWRYSNTASS